ncbi:MAG: mechanosensitive ion channel [Arenicella sp.]|nr:mechanosensitive ion channel [Arenicella sp.]
MPDIFNNTYYGNTVLAWLIAMAIILGSFIAGKLLYWVMGTTVKKLTAKTKSNLDDIIVDMVEEPIVAILVLSGIWYAISTLAFSEAASATNGHLMQFAIIMVVAWLIVRLLDALYEEYLVPLAAATDGDMDDQILPLLRKGSKIVVWCMAIIVGLNNAGIEVTPLVAGLGIGGLAFAMAAKDTVAYVFGGFTIFTDKPFTINDRVQVSGFDGVVTEIGVRSTRLKTLEGRIVTIPNSTFADSAVENVSLEPARKVSLTLGLTYDTEPSAMENAIQMLNGIAADNADVNENVVVYFSGFGDFSMNITFIYYIRKGASIAATQNTINLAILRQFNAAKLEFAFPTQTLHNVNAASAK